MEMKFNLLSQARAFATKVLEQPGGPYINKPSMGVIWQGIELEGGSSLEVHNLINLAWGLYGKV